MTEDFALLASSAASLVCLASFLSFSTSFRREFASLFALSTILRASPRAFSSSRSLRVSISASIFAAFSLSAFAASVISSAFECSPSISRRLFSSISTTSSNRAFSEETSSPALSIIVLSIPNLSEIAKAFDLPGIPIKSLYVGLKELTSNSHEPFSTLGV